MIDRAPRVQLLGRYGCRHLAIKLDDFNRVLPFLPEPPFPHRAMLLMALNTGMRWADLSSMEWGQIHEDVVHFNSSKTQKEGLVVPLMAKVREALAALPTYGHTEKIFINPATNKPYSNIRKSLARAIQLADVPHFTMHSIRHLATTLLLEETKDRDLVQRVMGWSDQAMVKRYGHISDRAERAFMSLNAKLDRQIGHTQGTPKSTIENESR